MAFWLLYPAIRLTDTVFGRWIPVSDSGLNNTVALTLASVPANLIIYSLACFLPMKIAAVSKRTKSQTAIH
jgi:hypothetical protein